MKRAEIPAELLADVKNYLNITWGGQGHGWEDPWPYCLRFGLFGRKRRRSDGL